MNLEPRTLNNLYPIQTKVSLEQRQQLLKQNAKLIWFTGLSGAGKTTLALGLQQLIESEGVSSKFLDGDVLRQGINSNLGFSPADRIENIRRVAEINKLFNEMGICTINAFISPTEELRQLAKQIIGADNFIEIFVNASLATCEKRDVKGLYAKARAGLIPNFTGIDSAYEVPQDADFIVETDSYSVEQSLKTIVAFLKNI